MFLGVYTIFFCLQTLIRPSVSWSRNRVSSEQWILRQVLKFKLVRLCSCLQKLSLFGHHCLFRTGLVADGIRLTKHQGLTKSGLEPTTYCTWGKHANHYTSDAVWLWYIKPEITFTFISSPDPKIAHLASVVRRKLFQKSSPLKILDQWKPKLVWIITRVSSFKIVSGDAVHQPTWPLLLKIEHMVKLQVLGNNSKTVNNIKNLTLVKNDQHIKIYLPCNFEVNLITHLGVIALFSSNL